jgi:hypothetical protein
MSLNDNHRRVIVAAFRHIDRLLMSALWDSADSSPFGNVIHDLDDATRASLAARLDALRLDMARALDTLGVAQPTPSVSATASFATAAAFASLSLEDLDPKRLRGYGALDEDDEALLMQQLAAIRAAVDELEDAVALGR